MAPRRKTTGAASAAPVDKMEGFGGVVVSQVEVQTPELETGDIPVITTAKGAGPRGIIPEGTAMNIAIEHYSVNWMRPADEAAAKKLAALMKKK